MNSFNRMGVTIVLLLGNLILTAQESPSSSFYVGADFTSRYIWRGMLTSHSPAIQPTLEYSTGNFTAGTWASYTWARESYQEINLYLSYQWPYVALALYDYYIPVEDPLLSNEFFNYTRGKTAHTLDAVVTLADIPGVPIYITASMLVYGDDLNANDYANYSTYFEVGYPFSLAETILTAFAGFTPAPGLYAEKANVVNMGLTADRSLDITQTFSLPITASFIINPEANNAYMVVGISI